MDILFNFQTDIPKGLFHRTFSGSVFVATNEFYYFFRFAKDRFIVRIVLNLIEIPFGLSASSVQSEVCSSSVSGGPGMR